MKLFSFLFLAFLATSFANQALLKSLDKMSQDPVGHAILSAISLNVRAKTPLGEVGDLLQEILNKHLAESQQLESSSSANNDRLNNAIANDQALISAHQSAISTLQDIIANAQSSLANAEASLAADQKALSDEQQGIDDRSAHAAILIPAYDADISDLGNAIAAVTEAIAKMRTYKQSNEGSASFIQLGSTVRDKLKKVTDTVQGMKKKLAKHSNMFTPLIRELIDLSVTLNQSKADQVIELLTQLLGVLQDALSQTQDARAAFISNHEDAQGQGADNVDDLQGRIADLEQAIAGLNDKIAQAQSNLETTQENLAANQAKLSADEAELEAAQASYTKSRGRLDKLIEYIRLAINFFNQNLAEVDDYVASKIEASL